MKRLTLVILTAGTLCLNTPAADLRWFPTTAVWDTSTLNWLDANSAPARFSVGDNVLFDDAGTAQLTVKLATGLNAGTVMVDASSDYTLTTNVTGGGLTGLTSLTKRGSGKLTVDTDNTFTGPVAIESGILQVGNGFARGTLGGSSVANGSALVVNRTGTLNLTGALSGGGNFTNAAGTVVISGANTMSGLISVNAGTLTLTNAPAAGNASEVHVNATVGTAGTRLLLAGGVPLPAATTVKCLGTSSGANMRCNLLGNPGANSINGLILCSGDGLVQLNGSGVGEFVVAGPLYPNPDDGTPFNGQVLLRGSGSGRLTGTVSLPNAYVNKSDAGLWTISSTGNSWVATALNVGTLRLGADNALPASVNLQMGQNSSTATFDLGGFNQQIATLNLAAGLSNSTNTIGNSSTTADSILTIVNGGAFGGVIRDAVSNGARKVGLTILGGAQQLSANCTYSGPTIILGGGLSLVGSGSISNSATLELATGAAINVQSRSDTTLVLQPAQTLKGNGAFNIAGNLTSLGTIALKLNKSGGTLTSDSIGSVDQMKYGGTLKLELSGEALAKGDSFKLFSASSYAGAFSDIVPATPGAGLAWDLTTLNTDGTIAVGAPIATNPTNLTATVVAGGTQYHVSWPLDHLGWTLQGQTNMLSVGFSTNWVAVSGSDTTNEVFVPVDRANGSVLFRLFYQP